MNLSLSNRLGAAIALALGAFAAAPAQAVSITREFSSAWSDPAHPGHGFVTDVVDAGNGNKTLIAYWFTYDAQGRQMWVVGVGPVQGDRATLQAVTTSGGSFDNLFNPAAVQQQPWGTLEVQFTACNAGTVDFVPNNGPRGRIAVTRLTSRFNAACSGGISDDRASTSADSELIRFLQPTAAAPAASGKTRFEQRSDRTDFKVEAEDVPTGTYTLRVGGTARGTFEVASVANGTNGEIEFRSPVEPGKILLDFDPRGQRIDVERNGTVFLTTELTDTPPPGGGNGAPTGSGVYALIVEPSGNDGPELHAELELRAGRADFSVEVEDVPVGSYTLRVDGTERGTVQVVAVPGGTNGELEFRNPVEPGKVLLNFDPRGKLVDVSRGTQSVLSGLFPTQPTGPADDNGGGSGGGGNDDNGGGNGGNGGNGGGGNGGGGGTGGTPGTWSSALSSVGPDTDASGALAYEVTNDEREFEVEAEDLDDGSYAVVVDGRTEATMVVSRGRGEVKFNAPARAGRELLDFDPRGKTTEITRNGTVFLRGRLP
jgi:uncharacterized membrane protein YgcG